MFRYLSLNSLKLILFGTYYFTGMIPYSEPYQSMYQRRRLGALGMEWHPSSISFATGPDFSLGEDFQMIPILEPDAVFEMPEFLDIPFWEPENEAGSDNADSEYNASEENASEREQESLSASSYSDTDSDVQIIEVEHRQNDGRRRSKRKKVSIEVFCMGQTSRSFLKELFINKLSFCNRCSSFYTCALVNF